VEEEKKKVKFITEEYKERTALLVLQQCPFILQRKVGRGQGRASGGDEDKAMGITVF
jgi:hypothetical protein